MNPNDWAVAVKQSLAAVICHGQIAGYAQLSVPQKIRVDARALWYAARSVYGGHLLASVAAWLLCVAGAVWQLDLQGGDADMAYAGLLVWLLPSLARARRRALSEILGPHWGRCR